MSIPENGRGRRYAICDQEGCDANVIDLPLDRESAQRIVRTFFGWTRQYRVGIGYVDICRACCSATTKKETAT